MSKRVTLNDDDIELLEALLNKSINFIKPYNATELFANQRKQQLLNKLKSQHPRSVEALGVSGNGKTSIPQKGQSDE
jgi:hypothetical protein